jgi:hypothetical protein
MKYEGLPTLTITITPSKSRSTSGWLYEAKIDGRSIVTSSQPFIDSARVLLSEGVDPKTPLAMTHRDQDYDSLRSTIGMAAKLTVGKIFH